ncbi:Antilisterial bacteriocin subtilosin biosynthesis protein AlbA [bioreactor metagenome]|uniref:Antilisterial bacteriocin subtilosin biosynthesis protein AlbA n=1 Tax=bioreactor metagenome TaxID=1076179 RepID=A0A644W838_9ZZZZ
MKYYPKLLFLEITSECNLRCKQCFMWKLKDKENRLDPIDYYDLVKWFKSINNGVGAIILTGGEIFLKSNFVFSILSECNKLNIESVINTNGTLIPIDMHLELINNGPSKLVFSIDSQNAALHDYLRGVKGTFTKVTSTIKQLIALRNKSHSNRCKIYISSILLDENINDIDTIISFAKSLEIDGIVFQVLSPSFYSNVKIEDDIFFKKHFFKDKDGACAEIDKLIEFSMKDDFILNTSSDLMAIKEYIRSPYRTIRVFCKANEQNLIIDHMGNVKYCYNMETIFQELVGNIRFNSISDIIYSKKSMEARERMGFCNLSCGILNCNK